MEPRYQTPRLPDSFRRQFMLRSPVQQFYVASLLARAGYKYIIGWRDVRGFGLQALRYADWQGASSSAYINLR